MMIGKLTLVSVGAAVLLGSVGVPIAASASEHHGGSGLRASAGGRTGENSPGSPSGSPGSTVTNCRNGSTKQEGVVNVGLGNVCGIGILNGLLSNDINGLLSTSGHSTGGLLNTSGKHSTGGLLTALLGG